MNEVYYDLYKRNPDYSEYVDKFRKARNLGVFEALEVLIVKEYGNCVLKLEKERELAK